MLGDRGWPGRVGGHADAEPADGPGQFDQLDCVGQLAQVGRRVGGRVAGQRHQVFDPGLPEVDQDVGQLQSGVAGAGQVGHRVERRQAQHRNDEVGRPLA